MSDRPKGYVSCFIAMFTSYFRKFTELPLATATSRVTAMGLKPKDGMATLEVASL